MSAERLKVVLLWHMHQPQYRDLVSGTYHLPWVYLHAIKDYVDMAAHLEAVPGARVVVNFAPLLLEQLEDYARVLDGFLHNGLAIPDPLLAALASPALPVETESRLHLAKACLRAHETRLIGRFAPYRELAEMARWLVAHPSALRYVSDQFLADLLVWYHLAWLGETVRRSGDGRVHRLMDKARGYSLHDRRELLTLIHELIGGIVPRYRRLAERGQVELSVTPYAHPILPLLLDFAVARESLPEAVLPQAARYPGGEERARWHVLEGLRCFERHFGFKPMGCWPAEGGVSAAALRLLAEAGFAWTASGEGVLRASLARAHHAMKAAWLYRPYQAAGAAGASLACFFRDDGLSDLIGFSYAGWHADDAVADLVHHLEQIAPCCRGHPDRVVTIALDGENAWEYYPENGYYFLKALYTRLAQHPQLELTTFSDCLKAQPVSARLETLVAGSWVYGNFSTWIGERSKNRGWDMLVEAKQAYDAARVRLEPGRLAQATQQLAICEGSDWFWWFGDENPAGTVADFERLYRQHLANLYQLLGVEPPEYLARAFAFGAGAPALGGVMKPATTPSGGGA